ncbi:RagB/SusD family nutrient uptake outer membrane protein [Olivibacter sp. XZL3]|uniref:RagB/SusD family nutrient uptake outer membrane protein n=1 Tax=Olivibacter sp. XZL3 TaxID=1735116 RepID=UPI001066B264|nr:RagB/SusD family nutrient uptake outer membrane protein [Olivibacter sp. XZL3]
MNTNQFMKYLVLLAVITCSFASCTKDFEDLNTDNTGVSDEDLKPNGQDLEIFFRQAQMSIYNFSGGGDPNSYQVQQNLNADVYSGYFMSPTPFNSGQNNLNYAMVNGWNGEPFKVLYVNVLNSLNKLKNNGLAETYPAVWAAALVIKAEATSRVTDIYGPIPYSQIGTTGNIPYDSQEDIYKRLFLELDTARNLLLTFNSGTDTTQVPANIEEADLVYRGVDNKTRFQKWLRLANSLRLRLAMRIVKADPQLAQSEAEKALDPANGGVIDNNADNFRVAIPSGANFSNPLYFIAQNWGDTRINASLESYMVGYADPRIGKYMDKATDNGIAGQYKGIRAGAAGLTKDAYLGYSSINVNDGTPSFTASTAPVLMTAAEVYFLRAEAALRGWANAGGSAQSLYEQGIQASFAQWGVQGADTYMQNSTNTPIAYVDPKNSRNNAASPTNITIQWNEGASAEEKLERIITQKWLAIFPEGQEAWSEFRRTGYPKIFPVVVNNSGGLVDTEVQIRRLPFSQNEYNTNAAEVQKAIQLLGGPDNAGTRLWWDKPQTNF